MVARLSFLLRSSCNAAIPSAERAGCFPLCLCSPTAAPSLLILLADPEVAPCLHIRRLTITCPGGVEFSSVIAIERYLGLKDAATSGDGADGDGAGGTGGGGGGVGGGGKRAKKPNGGRRTVGGGDGYWSIQDDSDEEVAAAAVEELSEASEDDRHGRGWDEDEDGVPAFGRGGGGQYGGGGGYDGGGDGDGGGGRGWNDPVDVDSDGTVDDEAISAVQAGGYQQAAQAGGQPVLNDGTDEDDEDELNFDFGPPQPLDQAVTTHGVAAREAPASHPSVPSAVASHGQPAHFFEQDIDQSLVGLIEDVD